MQLMSELSQMRLYSSRRKVYIPFNPDDKKRGAAIKLLTRHIEDSINMMHTPYIYNPKYYDSFYIPRDVMAYINSDNAKEYDNDTKDDDDVLMEAIMNRADTFRFDYTCTEHDADIVKKIITAKKIKDLYELFHRGSYNWKPFTVYIFDNQRQLAKAINQEAILRNADYVAHSYCTERELFIVSPTGFKEISKAEVDYELYVMDELTTWVVMNCFPKCGRVIANHVGAGISGHARAIYNKKWDSYDIVDHGKAPNDRIEMAKCIDTVYRKYGIAPIIKLCKGDPDEFLKYSSIIAKDFVVDFGKGTVNTIKKLINHETVELLNENILKNAEDIYYNKDKFDSGEINLCFIAGHSGSGKSTLGREMQGGIVETYELDDLMCVKDHFTMDNLKEYGDLIYSYFNGVGKKYYVTCEELDNGKLKVDDYEFELVRDFVDYAMKYAKSHKDRKFVLEGIWILNDNYFSPYEFKDYAFYIKGTSMIISYARAVKRDARKPNGKFDLPKGAADFLFNRRAWRVYGAIERSIKRFVSYFREKTSAGIKENTILESDGTHSDAIRIFVAMSPQDKKWLDGTGKFVFDDGKDVIYRHIERGEGIMDLKGFIEIKRDGACPQADGITGTCIIGVHPRHRREGIGKAIVKQAIEECKKENPDVSNLIWRVRADNKASQALAESCGFKLVRRNEVQYMYRYEYTPNKDYKYLDNKVLDENDLYWFIHKKFKFTEEPKLTDRVRDVSDIAKTMKGTYADAARLSAAYLTRMGISNRIACIYVSDKDKNIIYTRWLVIMTYDQTKFMGMDFTLLDPKKEYAGLKVGNNVDAILNWYSNQLMGKTLNDCPDEVYDTMNKMNYYLYEYYGQKTGTRYNTFITTVHNEASTSTVDNSYKDKPYDFPIPIQPSVHNAGKQLLEDGYISKDNYIITENAAIYFNEIDSNYDARIRRYIYKDRIKTSRELIGIYNTVKAKDKSIKRAYAKLDTYRGRNLFIDLSYYNDIFLNKLNLVKDKAVDLYFDFMQRLLKDSDEMRSRYNTSTIFIPVSNAAWNVGAGQSIIDYRQNINPISVIMRLLRRKPDLIKEALGGLNIIFLGKNGYFTADFSNFDMNKYGRLKNFFTRLAEADNIDDEDGYASDTDTDSNAALALKMVDKIENNTGITLNNVSPIVSDTKKETMKDKIDRLGKELEDLNTIDYHHTDLEHMRIRSTEVPVLGKNDLNNVNSPYGTILGVLVDENIGSSVADNVISAVTITDLGRFNPPIVNN